MSYSKLPFYSVTKVDEYFSKENEEFLILLETIFGVTP